MSGVQATGWVDERAERLAVGCLLSEPLRVASFARGVLRMGPECWRDLKLRRVVEVVFGLLDGPEANRADYFAVVSRLEAGEEMEERRPEWTALCGDCLELVGSWSMAFEGALEEVRAGWLARQAGFEALGVVEQSRERRAPVETETWAAGAAERMASVCVRREAERSNGEVMGALCDRWDDAAAFVAGDESKRPATGLPLPWPWLDDMLCGLEKGSLMVVAGRPSAGKTTFEDACAERVALGGKAVLRWTMDSTREELLARMLCRRVGVSLPKLKHGFARRDQRERVREEKGVVEKLPLFFFQGNGLREGMAWIRAMVLRHEVGLVSVDYMQQVQLTDERGFRADNENARLTIVSGALKQLCLDLGVPFMVLSQLSRSIEREGRQEGQLSDLRSSGAIEQDAEKVVFLSVDAAKRKEMEEKSDGATKHKRPVKFEVLKHKNGEIGWKPMWMLPAYFRFDGPAAVGTRVNGKGQTVRDSWSDDEVVE